MASLGGADTIRTLSQSASISSAKIRGREVFDPWPISLAGDMMVIVPSADIVTQGLRVADVAAAALEPIVETEINPVITLKLRPAAPIITPRRVTSGARRRGSFLVIGLALLRCALDCAQNPRICPTSTDVRTHIVDDVVTRGLWIFCEQCCSAHDLPRLTVAALRHLFLEPRLLHRMTGILRQTFDCSDGASGCLGQRGLAGES